MSFLVSSFIIHNSSLQKCCFITRTWIITAGILIQRGFFDQPLVAEFNRRQFPLTNEPPHRLGMNVQAFAYLGNTSGIF
jgi:hypothetical protein